MNPRAGGSSHDGGGDIRRVAMATTLDGVRFDSLLVAPAEAGPPPPVVMVFHDWSGRSRSQEAFAETLAGLGYAAVCVDLYGFGRQGATPAECEALMAPLVADRALLRQRLERLTLEVAQRPEVDGRRIAAIGFCFGGLCVLDLARAGAPVRAVASFHGLFTPSGLRDAKTIDARVALFHGWRDPFAPPSDMAAIAQELEAATADWQLHAFGDTAHAFMTPGADDPANGIRYSATVARRAWSILGAFLAESLTP
jgi:dienelactone hydrolase